MKYNKTHNIQVVDKKNIFKEIYLNFSMIQLVI